MKLLTFSIRDMPHGGFRATTNDFGFISVQGPDREALGSQIKSAIEAIGRYQGEDIAALEVEPDSDGDSLRWAAVPRADRRTKRRRELSTQLASA